MAITEQSRKQLYQGLEDVLGEERAATLMEHLPPVGWADVATKHDLEHVRTMLSAELAHHAHVTDLRFARLEDRFEEVDRRFDDVDRRFEEVDRRFEEVDRRFDQMEGRFDQIDRRFDQIDRRFDQMEGRFDGLDKVFATKADLVDLHRALWAHTIALVVAMVTIAATVGRFG